jgi:hypothetical protein
VVRGGSRIVRILIPDDIDTNSCLTKRVSRPGAITTSS